jgi:hypothetical protein
MYRERDILVYRHISRTIRSTHIHIYIHACMHAYYPCIYIYSYMTKYNNIHTIHISIICNPPKTQRPAASRRSPTSRRRWSLRSWRNWSMTPSSQRPHGCDAVRHGGSYTKLLPVLYNGYLWKYDMYNIWCIYIYICTYRCTYILHVLRSDLFL